MSARPRPTGCVSAGMARIRLLARSDRTQPKVPASVSVCGRMPHTFCVRECAGCAGRTSPQAAQDAAISVVRRRLGGVSTLRRSCVSPFPPPRRNGQPPRSSLSLMPACFNHLLSSISPVCAKSPLQHRLYASSSSSARASRSSAIAIISDRRLYARDFPLIAGRCRAKTKSEAERAWRTLERRDPSCL